MILSKDDIYFVLVRTRFASNLGGAVRVMKNMGFRKLLLVEPQCEVGIEARTLAMRGADILDRVHFRSSLQEVAEELNWLAATTGRFRSRKTHLSSCRDFCEELAGLNLGQLGLVFGPEDNGLSRKELRICDWLVEIPTGSDYPVLNLAQAVGILAYELQLALHPIPSLPRSDTASAKDVKGLVSRIEEVLASTPFSQRVSVSRWMDRIRKIATRARLESQDVNMLRGLLNRVQNSRDE